jgi:hypothetical protein
MFPNGYMKNNRLERWWMKAHYNPQEIVVIEIEISHLVFWVHVDITSWIIIFHFKYIVLTLDLN